MTYNLAIKGDGLDRKRVEALVERRVARLRRRTRRFPDDGVHLHAVIAARSAKPRVRAALSLRIPSRTLAVHEESKEAKEAIRLAFEELERALDKEKKRLRAERDWGRATREFRVRLARRLEEAPVAEAETRVEALGDHVPALERFAARELRALEEGGDLMPNELEPLDVVDAAILCAVERFEARPPGTNLRPWLLGLLVRSLREQVQRAQRERLRTVHLEEHVPEIRPEERVSTLGGEQLDFHQADFYLSAEDVLPNLDLPTPEDEGASLEAGRLLASALQVLPSAWRQAFVLRVVEELELEEAATAAARDTATLERDLDLARAFLREKLTEAGWTRATG